MAWTIELTPAAERQLGKLPHDVQQRVVRYLATRVSAMPRRLGGPLHGQKGEFWRYRVGDYRIMCRIEDERVTILVVRIGHRRQTYDR